MKFETRVPGVFDSDELSLVNAFRVEGESLTHQEFKEECDINTIINRFGIGVNPIVPQEWVTDVDISEAATDYQSAMNQLLAAQAQFMSLPASIRSEFQNDPGKFVAFASDPENLPKMVELGLAVKREEPIKASDQPVQPAAGTGST